MTALEDAHYEQEASPVDVVPPSIPLITPNRCSRRLSETRGGQEYQIGKVVLLVPTKKALTTVMSLRPINALHLLSEDTLLNFVNICGIDICLDDVKYSHNLGYLRSLEMNNMSHVV